MEEEAVFADADAVVMIDSITGEVMIGDAVATEDVVDATVAITAIVIQETATDHGGGTTVASAVLDVDTLAMPKRQDV